MSWALEVEHLECRRLFSTFTVTNTNDSGSGSLRQAILNSNTTHGRDTITFNIAGSGVQTINLDSGLTITDTVFINGYTQPGASQNTLAVGDNAALKIEVEQDPHLSAAFNAITIAPGADQTTLSGLAIANVQSGDGLNVQSNVVQIFGDYFGLNADGTPGAISGGDDILTTGSGTAIGTSGAGMRNVLGNAATAIDIAGGTSNSIQNDYIGVDPSGTAAAPTGEDIDVESPATSTIIGGTAAGVGDVISGATQEGILLHNTSGSTVQGNLIGVNAADTALLGNSFAGILLRGGSANAIGGVATGAGNVIAHSASAPGVLADTNGVDSPSVDNPILGNTFVGSAGLPIDLSAIAGPDGVTPNDFLDGDSGPNDLQNSPVLNAALFSSSTNQTTVVGSLNSLASSAFRIEFYDTKAGVSSFVGTQNANTDANGNASFSVPIQGFSAGSGDTITATATSIVNGSDTDTSEFSAGVNGQTAPTTSIFISSVTQTVRDSGSKVFNFTVTRTGVTSGAANVRFTTANGSAIAPTDFSARSGVVSFANNATTRTISIIVKGHSTSAQTNKNFFVNLSNPRNATIVVGQGVGTIRPWVTFQAESAVLAGGAVVASSDKGFTGTGYAQFGATDSSVTFDNVSRADDDSASLIVRYANGSKAQTPLSVNVNGAVVGSISCPPTGSAKRYKNVTLTVNLLEGENTIALAATGAAGPNLDSLTVT